MKILSNPHTHTKYVDGKNTAFEMAAGARARGFVSLGFSEHASQPIDQNYALSAENEQKYIADINSLKAAYAGEMRVWLGIERDRVSSADITKYDYILAASHYFTSDDGDFISVDSDANSVERFVKNHFAGDWVLAYETYFSQYAEYVSSVRPNIIAHFDLIAKDNRETKWFSESSDEYLAAGNRALERMIKACKVLELNTGGIARSNQPAPYPIKPFMETWRRLGGSVIPSSDCHREYQLDAWFDNAPAYIKSCGFDSYLQLGTGAELFERVPL